MSRPGRGGGGGPMSRRARGGGGGPADSGGERREQDRRPGRHQSRWARNPPRFDSPTECPSCPRTESRKSITFRYFKRGICDGG